MLPHTHQAWLPSTLTELDMEVPKDKLSLCCQVLSSVLSRILHKLKRKEHLTVVGIVSLDFFQPKFPKFPSCSTNFTNLTDNSKQKLLILMVWRYLHLHPHNKNMNNKLQETSHLLPAGHIVVGWQANNIIFSVICSVISLARFFFSFSKCSVYNVREKNICGRCQMPLPTPRLRPTHKFDAKSGRPRYFAHANPQQPNRHNTTHKGTTVVKEFMCLFFKGCFYVSWYIFVSASVKIIPSILSSQERWLFWF